MILLFRTILVLLLVYRGYEPAAHAAFCYADVVTTTGGQFSPSYSPTNLINNGFVSATNTIDTTVDYLAAGNNYASVSGTSANFNLTFNFNTSVDLTGMNVWNYVYRSGANGAASTNSGVNAYTLTFYSATDGTGSVIGTFSGNLNRAAWNALNPAQVVNFGSTNFNVRSVVFHVSSNFGATFTGMNELAFETSSVAPPPLIGSFTVSTNLVTYGSVATLSWQVGYVTRLIIDNGIGDVLGRTTNGAGSLQISPTHGSVTYTLTGDGAVSNSVSLVGLPTKEKLHIYLLIGQSNMQGNGDGYDLTRDAPDPRGIKYGSRDGMETNFVTGGHRLFNLNWSINSKVGMGVEFGKTIIKAETDPDVVICLINHAVGGTAIQWWRPGVTNPTYKNATTGKYYKLYDEALQRVRAASAYGVVKGVLWHQGEYNANGNSATAANGYTASDPSLYAGNLLALVDQLRADIGDPGLPFICGKLSPTYPFPGDRVTVETALADLPNQRANTFCVDNTGLTCNAAPDNIHFNAASQCVLGQRYATAMTNLYADPYRLYMGGFYTPAQLTTSALMNPLADNDGDGEANYLEYALKTRPDLAADVQHFTGGIYRTNNLSYPAVTFRERVDTEAPGYLVEVSNDLLNWRTNQTGQPPETMLAGPVVANTNGTQTVTFRYRRAFEAGLDRVFLRLRVSPP